MNLQSLYEQSRDLEVNLRLACQGAIEHDNKAMAVLLLEQAIKASQVCETLDKLLPGEAEVVAHQAIAAELKQWKIKIDNS